MFIKLIGIWIVGVLVAVAIYIIKAKTCYDCVHADVIYRCSLGTTIYCTRTHKHKEPDICEHFKEVKR